jgi:ABC-type polysaccharide/polyol phosphate export permease
VSLGGSLLKSVVFPSRPAAVGGAFHLTQYPATLRSSCPSCCSSIACHLPQMLLFPVFLGLQLLFITGLALGLSAATALFRDVRHLVEVGMGMLFWATPVIYEMDRVPESFRFLALLSPSASHIRAHQDIFYYGVVPDSMIGW